jgi:hypothetical protein
LATGVTLAVTWPRAPEKLHAAGPTISIDAGVAKGVPMPATVPVDAGSALAMRDALPSNPTATGPSNDKVRTDVPTNDTGRIRPIGVVVKGGKPDAGVAAVAPAQLRTFRLNPNPKSALYSIDDSAFEPVGGGGRDIKVGPGPHTVRFRHETCEDDVQKIAADEPGGRTISANPRYKPTSIIPRCDNARVMIDGKPAEDGLAADIASFTNGTHRATVVFFPPDGEAIKKTVIVRAGDPPKDVSCTEP